MSQASQAEAPHQRGRDRYGWRPVRRGWIRGQIRNVRRGNEVGDYGTILVMDFELFVDDDAPMVAVRMRGTDFQGQLYEGKIADIRDPGDGVRPIEVTRLRYPPQYAHDVRSYYPGRDDPTLARQRIRAMVPIIGPIAVAAAMIGLFYVFYR